MREIKFRLWHKTSKCFESCFMVNPQGLLLDPRASHPALSLYNDDHYVLMQFTGLKDKNGKDIYEGDILSFQFDNPSANYKLAVEWKTGMTECCQSCFDGYETKDFDKVKVIGNIYENPELKGE